VPQVGHDLRPGEAQHDVFPPLLEAGEEGIALRLAKFFGVSADFWLNLQVRWDLYRARLSEADELGSIMDFHHLRKTA